MLNSISPHGLLVISVIQTKNVPFKSVKICDFGPKWPFSYIFGGKSGPYTQFSDFIRLNMSYLSDSHGDLIETHKIIPIVILEIPPVAHIRAWMRGFYVRFKGEMAYKWPLNGAHESKVDENWKIFNFLNRFYLFYHLKVKEFGITLEKLVRVLEDVFQISWVSLKITFLEEMCIFLGVLWACRAICFIFSI